MRKGSHVHDVQVQRLQDSNERRNWQLLLQVVHFVLLQVVHFVEKCEAMFSTEQLKISKCTWNKCLLEIDLASSVKPSNIIATVSRE